MNVSAECCRDLPPRAQFKIAYAAVRQIDMDLPPLPEPRKYEVFPGEIWEAAWSAWKNRRTYNRTVEGKKVMYAFRNRRYGNPASPGAQYPKGFQYGDPLTH